MKILNLIYLLVFFILASCNQKAHDQMNHEGNESAEEGSNEALYNQMMDVHDEIMPQMDQIMKLKRELTDKIANSPELVAEQKEEIEKVISNLDSASNAMMDWMHRVHKYDPKADTANSENSREFLETEMERIRKVKNLMEESIEQAKVESTKN